MLYQLLQILTENSYEPFDDFPPSLGNYVIRYYSQVIILFRGGLL